MGNRFTTDVLIQAEDVKAAARFYVEALGFQVTDQTPDLISLRGEHINLFIDRGPALGPVLELRVDSVEKSKAVLLKRGCTVVREDPAVPRCYVRDPFGLTYNLAE
jgi:hypothetical protein